MAANQHESQLIARYIARMRTVGALTGENDATGVDNHSELAACRMAANELLARMLNDSAAVNADERVRFEQELRSRGDAARREAYRDSLGRASIARGASVEAVNEQYESERRALLASELDRLDAHADSS